MTIELQSEAIPANGEDFSLIEDLYFKGGLQIRQDVVDRDSIPIPNLKLGALVYTISDNTIWQVSDISVPTVNDPDAPFFVEWQEFSLGGSVRFAFDGEGTTSFIPVGDIYLRDLQVDEDEFGRVTLVDPGQPLVIWDTTVNGGNGGWVFSDFQTATRFRAGAGISLSTIPYTDDGPNQPFGQRTLVISANIPTTPDPAPFFTIPVDRSGISFNLDSSDTNLYQRFTNPGEKFLTIRTQASHFYDGFGEWKIRNVGAGVLNIIAQNGVTINPPASGVLTLDQGVTATIKRIAEDEFDLIV